MSDALRLRAHRRTDRTLVILVALTPVAFIDYGIAGYRMSGWAWIAMMLLALPRVLSDPIDMRAVRALAPYLAFLLYSVVTVAWVTDVSGAIQTLLQLCMLALVYLIGWRIHDVGWVTVQLRKVALVAIGAGAVLGTLTAGGTQAFAGIGYVTRPAAISLIGMFIIAGMTIRSWITTSFLAVFTFGVAVLTGSRMAAAALVIVYLTNHAVRRSRPRWIMIMSLVVLGVLALSATPQFKERFFFSDDASLTDVVTASEQLNTAGRRELWPNLLEVCAPTQVFGAGVGAATTYSLELTNTVLAHPHNEYLRIYCDQGWIGSILFWSFLVTAARRRVVSLRRGGDPSLQTAALQFIVVTLVISMTDNPLLYTALFMVPLAAVVGMADGAAARQALPPVARVRRVRSMV